MQYEIEIKTLLTSQSEIDELIGNLTERDPATHVVSRQEQLNHYFKGGTLSSLSKEFTDALSDEYKQQLAAIERDAASINVRSRQKNDQVLLIVKGAASGSAVHAHERMEFEAVLPLSLDQVDERITKSGWQLEAKWQAKRTLYESCGMTIDTLFTPGYGYVVEFEKVVNDTGEREKAHDEVVGLMNELGVTELDPARLERMFAYYNEHWSEYYGTDRVFTVE